MGLAERADVIVDFRGLEDGTVITMTNTAPDAPFGGFPDIPADPATTGQVMQFVVNSALSLPSDAAVTPPQNLVMNAEAQLPAAELTRHVSLNEGESEELCVDIDLAGNVVPAVNSAGAPVLPTNHDPVKGDPCYDVTDMIVIGFPMGPKEALLGTVDCVDAAGNPTGVAPCDAADFPVGNPLKWTANGVGVSKSVTVPSGTVNVWVTENPGVGAVEDWEIYNFTADAHPIHQHLVRFEVKSRAAIPGWMPVNPIVQPWELGMKDTVISYPGEITVIRSKFDIAGLYVWHCHIVEHEDNEMMRPYFVGP
jgi:FtsP/CotA-like multicopper oxidase with cupredoxin domain